MTECREDFKSFGDACKWAKRQSKRYPESGEWGVYSNSCAARVEWYYYNHGQVVVSPINLYENGQYVPQEE